MMEAVLSMLGVTIAIVCAAGAFVAHARPAEEEGLAPPKQALYAAALVAHSHALDVQLLAAACDRRVLRR